MVDTSFTEACKSGSTSPSLIFSLLFHTSGISIADKLCQTLMLLSWNLSYQKTDHWPFKRELVAKI